MNLIVKEGEMKTHKLTLSLLVLHYACWLRPVVLVGSNTQG